MAQRARASSIEQQIEKSIAEWIEDGLIADSGWTGKPLIRTPLPKGKGIWFDPRSVERVLRFFLLLTQTIGRWAGLEFRLFDWQVRYLIAPVFGIKHADGRRVIRTVWFEIPRKNGKSTLCSGLGLYLFSADREWGAEVYAAAGSRVQAGVVFRAARAMANGSKALREKLGRKGIQRALLEHPVTGAIFRALSSNGDLQHGLNVHAAIIDEVHVHKNPDVIEALESGTGSREQPLIVFITTADAGTDGTIYTEKREYIEALCAGTKKDQTTYGVVFAADEKAVGFDPFSDETIIGANPGAGSTVTMEYLRTAAVKARSSQRELASYLRLHLNVRTKQTTKWLPLDRFDTTRGEIDPNEWKGTVVRGGLDLATASDLTAFVVRGAGEVPLLHALFWIPEERIGEIEKRTKMPIGEWVKDGWIAVTEGNVTDYSKVRADIIAELERLDVMCVSIAYDQWNATETAIELAAAGFAMVPTRQGYGQLSAPAKQIERQVLGSKKGKPLVRTGVNPVLRWMADCVEVRTDDAGNIKPVKPDREKSTKRIDGIVAWIMAEREAMLGDAAGGSSAMALLDGLMIPCPSCAVVNASSRVLCSSCGAQLGQPA